MKAIGRAANWLKAVANHALAVLRGASNPARVVSVLYVTLWKHLPIRRGLVLLESHHGVDFIGSPYYMLKCMLQHEEFSHLTFVVASGPEGRARLGTLGDLGRVRWCRPRSLRYVFYLATAEWLVSDVTFPVYFSRRDGQRYLNTWHGTPMKALGRRARDGVVAYVGNTQRNFLHATHILAPNPHTEYVILNDYMIRDVWRGRLIRCGYPRNDVLKRVFPGRDKAGLDVAFMPTWRGNLSTVNEASRAHADALLRCCEELEEGLPDGVIVWVRIHPLAKSSLNLDGFARVRFFPDGVEPYEHLARCDVLVTDYSSVVFDFASTRRPVVLFTPDVSEYRVLRDFCVDVDGLPFDRVFDSSGLVEVLRGFLSRIPEPGDGYSVFVEKYCLHDSGSSALDLCRAYFLDDAAGRCLQESVGSDKCRLLVFAGGLMNNGITTSLKNLVSLLDKDKYSITLCANDRAIASAADYFGDLDIRVGYVPLSAVVAVGPIEAIRFLAGYFFGWGWSVESSYLKSIWRREFRRLFGSADFDVFVNFDGYSWRAALLGLGVDFPRVVFMHNDMAAEIAAGRVADPRLLRMSYEYSDCVAVVREGVEESYCSKHYDVSGRVRFVPNTLSDGCVDKALHPLLEAFLDPDCADTLRAVKALSKGGGMRFVNVARFSPEKGQLRLIEAFERVWRMAPDAELFIVGPHGSSFDEVAARARQSVAADNIFVVMGSGNPFPLVARMDTLVFSSYYEGIGLVLYEAFALGLSVVSTNIPGPAGLLSQGYGLLVENSADGLVDGMLSAMRGAVPSRVFDFRSHNQVAVSSFCNMVDSLSGRS